MTTDAKSFAAYRHPWELSADDFLAGAIDADADAAETAYRRLSAIGVGIDRHAFSCVRDLLGGWGLKQFAVVALRQDQTESVRNRTFCLLHRAADRPIGFARGSLIWVDPDYRGLGLATALVIAVARNGGGAPGTDQSGRLVARSGVRDGFDACARVLRSAHRVSCRLASDSCLQVPRDNLDAYRLSLPADRSRPRQARAALDRAKSMLVSNLDRNHDADWILLPNGDRLTQRSGAQYLQTMLPEGRVMVGTGSTFLLHRGVALDLAPAALGHQPVLLDVGSPMFEKRYGASGRLKPIDQMTDDLELAADRSIFMAS